MDRTGFQHFRLLRAFQELQSQLYVLLILLSSTACRFQPASLTFPGEFPANFRILNISPSRPDLRPISTLLPPPQEPPQKWPHALPSTSSASLARLLAPCLCVSLAGRIGRQAGQDSRSNGIAGDAAMHGSTTQEEETYERWMLSALPGLAVAASKPHAY